MVFYSIDAAFGNCSRLFPVSLSYQYRLQVFMAASLRRNPFIFSALLGIYAAWYFIVSEKYLVSYLYYIAPQLSFDLL